MVLPSQMPCKFGNHTAFKHLYVKMSSQLTSQSEINSKPVSNQFILFNQKSICHTNELTAFKGKTRDINMI